MSDNRFPLRCGSVEQNERGEGPVLPGPRTNSQFFGSHAAGFRAAPLASQGNDQCRFARGNRGEMCGPRRLVWGEIQAVRRGQVARSGPFQHPFENQKPGILLLSLLPPMFGTDGQQDAHHANKSRHHIEKTDVMAIHAAFLSPRRQLPGAPNRSVAGRGCWRSR